MIEHYLKVRFEKPNHSLMRSGFVGVLNEVIEHLCLHKFFHELSDLAFELVQVIVEVKHIRAGKFIINYRIKFSIPYTAFPFSEEKGRPLHLNS